MEKEEAATSAPITSNEEIQSSCEPVPVEKEAQQNVEEQSNSVDDKFNIAASVRPQRSAFKFKQNNNGNILTMHHTVTTDDGLLLRVRFAVCCFNCRGTEFVAIDKRGNVFVFDMPHKRYWRLLKLVPKATTIRASIHDNSRYFVGTKLGQLYEVDVAEARIINAASVSDEPIMEISFPGQPLQPSQLLLLRAGNAAIIIDLKDFTATHRLDFQLTQTSLKFASYLPQSEQIFTCFSDDTVHIWSGVTLNALRVLHPIKERDRRLRLTGMDSVPEICLAPDDAEHFNFSSIAQHFTNGTIVAYCCQPDGREYCLATLDGYLLLHSAYTSQLERILRLRDFVFMQCSFLPQPHETYIVGVTNTGQALVVDCQAPEHKLLLELSPPTCNVNISLDGKLLAVLAESGEANIWTTQQFVGALKSQQRCMRLLRDAFKQRKPLAPAVDECFKAELQSSLKPERLLSILQEFGCYPAKYRSVIWCALLRLPYNQQQFQELLQLDTPAAVKQQATRLRLKNETLKRSLLKVWSCLAHWCKVLGYSEVVPQLIFPFVKYLSKHTLVAFEICATLVCNHFQLYFEFHPLPPANYLGMCENVLQHYDPELRKFYANMQLSPVDYAWSLLVNCFSEVLDEEQWLCLWDHIFSAPPYLPVFCVTAYNMLQREVLLHLPDKKAVQQFFHEQNPIDVCKFVWKSHKLLRKCPDALHPKRYMKPFQAIPQQVYPKFLNYPQKSVSQHEGELLTLQKEHREIDALMRRLELEEYQMMERLENGLKEEEHAKRLKEMETLYKDTLKREEERIAFQRKMLLVYQKELRNRKGQVYATLQEVERRKKALQMEGDLDALRTSIERERIRNDTNLLLAEDELRNQELELMAQKYNVKSQTQPLAQKYKDELERLDNERARLDQNLRQITLQPESLMPPPESTDTNLDDIEKEFNDIQEQFLSLKR